MSNSAMCRWTPHSELFYKKRAKAMKFSKFLCMKRVVTFLQLRKWNVCQSFPVFFFNFSDFFCVYFFEIFQNQENTGKIQKFKKHTLLTDWFTLFLIKHTECSISYSIKMLLCFHEFIWYCPGLIDF